ncbi:hypothetical protein ETD83_18065 [Actinomadura soli]|uniref:Uncharacterized protein n=1 Tax=Actinomadura soli TaxID=2508997 RepID=A0A5C4JAK1_9ACTN|nr:hypothetical protein [Actinomadura soli]TMQ99258.1 hypothetical protein ETD83_18065 [Actinomadura soli]
MRAITQPAVAALAALAAVVALLAGVPSASADPSPSATAGLVITSEAINPVTGTRAPAARTDQLPLTRAQVEREAARAGARHEANADDFLPAGQARARQYDYISPAECQASSEAATTGGWVKNHFAWCKKLATKFQAKSCDASSPPKCVVKGEAYIYFNIIGYGRHETADSPTATDRHMNYTLTMVKIDGEWGVMTRPDVKYTLAIKCWVNDPNNCKAPDTNGDTRTKAGWTADKDAYSEFLSPAKPPHKDHGEQLIYADTTAISYAELAGFPNDDNEQPMTNIRFDSAWYDSTYGKRGSIFTKSQAWLSFNRAANSGYKEVADHLWTALNRAKETKPPFSDKQIPGGSWDDPIRRLAPELNATTKSNEGKNRYWSKKACDTYFKGWDDLKGPDGKPIQQCDEFPFASTYDGAAKFDWDGAQYKDMFSARPVHRDDNNAAGTVLRLWYHWDRMVDKDPFFIKVQ